ncbi:hypothetical protein M0R45_025747 [Rubus argutus]|uniref:Uncharacterized protein n=1 Tax=Rubus argutus TaxID=59490 RepID=A0AAW1WX67_RUBAR
MGLAETGTGLGSSVGGAGAARLENSGGMEEARGLLTVIEPILLDHDAAAHSLHLRASSSEPVLISLPPSSPETRVSLSRAHTPVLGFIIDDVAVCNPKSLLCRGSQSSSRGDLSLPLQLCSNGMEKKKRKGKMKNRKEEEDPCSLRRAQPQPASPLLSSLCRQPSHHHEPSQARDLLSAQSSVSIRRSPCRHPSIFAAEPSCPVISSAPCFSADGRTKEEIKEEKNGLLRRERRIKISIELTSQLNKRK